MKRLCVLTAVLAALGFSVAALGPAQLAELYRP